MDAQKEFLNMGEYAAAGMYEEPHRSLFYRKALGLRRYYEHCALAEYQGKELYPSGVLPRTMDVCPHYLPGLSVNEVLLTQKNKALAELCAAEFSKYRSSVPQEHTVGGAMYTHSMPNYGRILAEGLLSYGERIKKIQDKDMREGLLHLLEGIKTYIERCVAYLSSVSADQKLICALKKVPLFPADNIYEAFVSWNFILYLDGCDNLGCPASEIAPYHRGEDITALLENLYDNLNENNGYSMALGTDVGPLTLQCLEASKGKRRPMIELFVDENTPREVWEKAFEVVKSGGGQPAFYNPAELKALQARIPSVTDADLRKFCGGGCTEAMLAGLSHVGSLDAGINLLLIFEETMHKKLPAVESFDAFYAAYMQDVRETVEHVCGEVSRSQTERARYNPLPMRTLLVDDCIDVGLDFNAGGARYKWSIINFAGLINVIDSMLVIKDFVFEDRIFTPSELLARLRDNDATFLATARKHPRCFGCDLPEVNAFSKKLSSDIFSLLDGKKPALGEAFLPASIQFMAYADAGAHVGATPDGRACGTPLADSLSAIFGKDTAGPTALLKSVASLDLARAVGIPILNFTIEPNFRFDVLRGLILGYFALGGLQMQITCASAAVLKEAYEHPELHRNLIVRVGGYSEYFHVLPDALKRMIIERTIRRIG